MPSLLVSKKQDHDAFEHFYNSLVDTHQQSGYDTLNILKIVLMSLGLAFVFFALINGIASIIYSEYPTIYKQYQLYYPHIWIGRIIPSFVLIVFIIHVFTNGYYNYSLKHNIFVSFIICILINGTITTLLEWQYHEYNNYIWYFECYVTM